nr:hypothetical protein HmN_000039560 [Hymenolepis microstoma]
MHKQPPDWKNQLLTTSWLCPSYWHAMNLCAEVIHQRLWHLSEIEKEDGLYNIEESPTEARVCRAFELSRWLAKQFPAKSSRCTPSRFVGGNADGDGTEKTPRTRRRDARRAAHRTQKEISHSHHPEEVENIDPSLWTAAQIASHFSHITGSEAKQISQLIESWQLADRQRILDTSFSMSELNGFGEREKTPQAPAVSTRCPPPRPPETYRRQSQPVRARTEEPLRRETRESSSGPSSKLLGFLRRPESKKKQLERSEMNDTSGGAEVRNDAMNGKHEHVKELLEVAAELKWLIAENIRQLAELCHEEARLTGRLPQDCIPECKAGHLPAPLTTITKSLTYQNPIDSPFETSVTPRPTITSNFPTVSQNGISFSSESWSLRRLPPAATDRCGESVGSTTLSLSSSTFSSINNQKDSHSASGPQTHQHLKADQRCEVMRYPALRTIETDKRVYQEVVNQKRDTLLRSGPPQSGRGAAMILEPSRQRSEPPRIGKVPQRHTSDNYDNFTHVDQHKLCLSRRPQLCEHNQREYLNPLYNQMQDPSFSHHFPHQRNRSRPPAYEMGDEEITGRTWKELKVAPQWALAVPTTPPPLSIQTMSISPNPMQSMLSGRERTPESERRNGFYISTSRDNHPDRSVKIRQSCSPTSNPRLSYLSHAVGRERDMETTSVYHSKPFTSQTGYVPRNLN